MQDPKAVLVLNSNLRVARVVHTRIEPLLTLTACNAQQPTGVPRYLSPPSPGGSLNFWRVSRMRINFGAFPEGTGPCLLALSPWAAEL